MDLELADRFYTYQTETIDRIRELENDSKCGVAWIRLPPAAGKTWITLGLIYQFPVIPHQPSKHVKDGIVYKTWLNRCTANVIITPHHLRGQLEEEIKRFHIDYVLLNNVKALAKFDPENAPTIVVLSFTKSDWKCVKFFFLRFMHYQFNRVIFDEFDQMNNFNVKHNANMTLLISASEQTIKESNWLYDFRYLTKRFGWVCTYSEDQIKESQSLPPIQHITLKCRREKVAEVLGGVAPAEILNMVRAGAINEMVEKLGLDSEKDLVTHFTKELLEKLDGRKERHAELLTRDDTYQNRQDIKKVLGEIKELENKITDLKKRLDSEGMCSICLDECENPAATRCCQNRFCSECIIESINANPKCPMCRTTLEIPSLVYEQKPELKDLSRKGVFIDYLKHNLCKTLVFCDHDFQTVIEALTEADIKFREIKGTSNTVKKIIDQFSKGEIDVLLLNSRHTGSGLNLQMTDQIIHYLETTASRIQNNGRGQRPGRTTSLKVIDIKEE